MHRLALCLHSGYFRRLCESTFKESSERNITLRDDPVPAVKAMIQYFYEFEYSYGPNQLATGSAAAYELHSQIFSIADK